MQIQTSSYCTRNLSSYNGCSLATTHQSPCSCCDLTNQELQYVDPYGKAERVADVFSKIKMAREHYEKVGLGADFVDHFIR